MRLDQPFLVRLPLPVRAFAIALVAVPAFLFVGNEDPSGTLFWPTVALALPVWPLECMLFVAWPDHPFTTVLFYTVPTMFWALVAAVIAVTWRRIASNPATHNQA